jgi:hypothetical protein
LLTIASNDKELVIFADVVDLNIRVGGNYLLLGREVGALLELEVSDSSRQGEIAVDTTEIDEASSGLDTCFLGCLSLEQPCEAAQVTHLRSGACGRRRGASPGL